MFNVDKFRGLDTNLEGDKPKVVYGHGEPGRTYAEDTAAVPPFNNYWSHANDEVLTTFEGKKKVLHLKSWGTSERNQDRGPSVGTPANPRLNAIIDEQLLNAKQTAGSFKFFIEKLHGKTADGRWNVKNKIYKRDEDKKPSDLPNRMVFPAYIANYNDGYSANWGDYSFLGRSEKVHIYQNTSRELTLEFYLLSDFSSDLLFLAADQKALEAYKRSLPNWGDGTFPDPLYTKDGNREGFVPSFVSGTTEMLWHRYTFLAQCVYPWYRADGKMKEQPFVRLRIGDFYDVVGIITRLNSSNENFELDLNKSARNNESIIGEIPLALKITLQMTIVHDEEPSSTYYKFYNAKAYDNGATSFPSMSSSSKTKDTVLDSLIDGGGNSNLNSSSSRNLTKQETLEAAEEAASQSEEMKQIDQELKAIDELEEAGKSLNQKSIKTKLKKALKSAAVLGGALAISAVKKAGTQAIESATSIGGSALIAASGGNPIVKSVVPIAQNKVVGLGNDAINGTGNKGNKTYLFPQYKT
jgi:hypothetical protein